MMYSTLVDGRISDLKITALSCANNAVFDNVVEVSKLFYLKFFLSLRGLYSWTPGTQELGFGGLHTMSIKNKYSDLE